MIADEELTGSPARKAAMLAALLSCSIFIVLGFFAPGPILPQIEKAFAGTPNVAILTQLVPTISSFVFAISAPFAGGLIARVGCRRVMIPSAVAIAIFGTLPMFLDDLWLILASRGVVGLCVAGVYTSGLVGIGAMPPARRAGLFGWFTVVAGLGSLVVFATIGALAVYGWRLPFVAYLSALVVVPLALALPASLGVLRRAEVSAADAPVSRGVLFTPALVGLLAMAMLLGMNFVVSPVYAPVYLASIGISDPHLLAMPAMAGSILATPAAMAYGTLLRWLGSDRLTIVSIIIMGVAVIAAGMTTSLPLFAAAIGIHNAMSGLLATNFNSVALTATRPERSSQALGLMVGVLLGSQLLFPFFATAIEGTLGVIGVFVVDGASLIAVGLIVAALAVARMRAPKPAAL